WVPGGYDSEVGAVTNPVGLMDLSAAADWRSSLVAVRAQRRTVAGSGAFDANRTEYSLLAVYRVDAPAGAVPGPYRFRAELRARGAGAQRVTINVDARPGATP